jgi:hypothetical protein
MNNSIKRTLANNQANIQAKMEAIDHMVDDIVEHLQTNDTASAWRGECAVGVVLVNRLRAIRETVERAEALAVQMSVLQDVVDMS